MNTIDKNEEGKLKFVIKEWEKLRPETARFIFEEAEKNLLEHLETGKLITTRATTIIGFCLPILAGLIGYVFNEIVKDRMTGFHFWIPVIICCPAIAILALSLDAYWIYKRSPVGNEPINIINSEKINSPHQEVSFVVKRIESIQRQILKNSERNKIRMGKLKAIEVIIVTTLIGSIIICVVYYLMNR